MRGAIMLALPNKSVASLVAHLGQQYPDELAEFRARLEFQDASSFWKSDSKLETLANYYRFMRIIQSGTKKFELNMVQFLSIFFWLNVRWIGKEKGKSIWTKVKHAKVFSLFAGTNSWECFENVSVNYAPENVLPAGIERMNIFIYRRIFISLKVFLESHPELGAITELRLQWPLLCSIDLRPRLTFAPFPVGYFFGTDQPILRALFSHVVDDLLAAKFTFQSSLGTLHSISFSPFALDDQVVANFLGCKQHNSFCFCRRGEGTAIPRISSLLSSQMLLIGIGICLQTFSSQIHWSQDPTLWNVCPAI
ncbi:hypothetical protein Ciccas_012763 [Cichlidogyrus casuarinus]|uniref:Maturase K n=1 Tax=Cichlidogyrus casuarinus TaxID=1844966 RepID=A0ABD2PMG3_9PLAT